MSIAVVALLSVSVSLNVAILLVLLLNKAEPIAMAKPILKRQTHKVIRKPFVPKSGGDNDFI